MKAMTNTAKKMYKVFAANDNGDVKTTSTKLNIITGENRIDVDMTVDRKTLEGAYNVFIKAVEQAVADGALDAKTAQFAYFADDINDINFDGKDSVTFADNNCDFAYGIDDNSDCDLGFYFWFFVKNDTNEVNPDALEVAVNAEIQNANTAKINDLKWEIRYTEGSINDLDQNHIAHAPNDQSLKERRAELVNELDNLKAQLAELLPTEPNTNSEYKYYLQSRRPIAGAVPNGYISATAGEMKVHSLRSDGSISPVPRKVVFGVAVYDHPLSDEQIINYDLHVDPLNPKVEPDTTELSDQEIAEIKRRSQINAIKSRIATYERAIKRQYDQELENRLIAAKAQLAEIEPANTHEADHIADTDKLIISAKWNKNDKITAYYINDEKVRKCDIEYYACNHGGFIEVDYHLAQNFHALKYPGDQRKVVYKDYYGQTLMSKAAADTLGCKIVKNNSLEIFYVEPIQTDNPDDSSNDVGQIAIKGQADFLADKIKRECASIDDSTTDRDEVFSLLPNIDELNGVELHGERGNHKLVSKWNETLFDPEFKHGTAKMIFTMQGREHQAKIVWYYISVGYGKGKYKFRMGTLLLGKYDTPAQVEKVIDLLKAAITRGDKAFTFPTVEELDPNPDDELIDPPELPTAKPRTLRNSLNRAIKQCCKNRIGYLKSHNSKMEKYEYELLHLLQGARRELEVA